MPNRGTNYLTKLRASDGQDLGNFVLGPVAGTTNTVGLAFDGVSVWAAMFGTSVVKVRPSDGVVLGTFTTAGMQHSAIAFDGTDMWVASRNTSNVTRIRASDGAVLGNVLVGQNPTGLVFDGTSMWVVSPVYEIVSKR